MTGPVTKMKHKERLKLLQRCRAKLQHLRANNSAGPTEVRTAENLYESALIAARWDGCPTVTGTDLPLSENNFFRAVFHADGINVLVVFYRGDEKIGRPLIFSAEEAIARGLQITMTQTCEECSFPISMSALYCLGTVLMAYGKR